MRTDRVWGGGQGCWGARATHRGARGTASVTVLPRSRSEPPLLYSLSLLHLAGYPQGYPQTSACPMALRSGRDGPCALRLASRVLRCGVTPAHGHQLPAVGKQVAQDSCTAGQEVQEAPPPFCST